MSIDRTKYEEKLKQIQEELSKLNYYINDKNELTPKIKSKTSKKYDTLSNYPQILKLLNKYIKLNLYLKYGMKKTRILPPNKDYFWSSKLLEKTSSHLINELLIVITDPLNDAGIFSKSNLLYDNINNGCIFPLIELVENKNYPLILLNPKKNNVDEYLENFWKIYIKNNLKYLHNIIIICQGMSSLPVIRLLNKQKRDFQENVSKIILINSKHKKYYQVFDETLQKTFMNKTINYILSNEPVGNLIYSNVNTLE